MRCGQQNELFVMITWWFVKEPLAFKGLMMMMAWFCGVLFEGCCMKRQEV